MSQKGFSKIVLVLIIILILFLGLDSVFANVIWPSIGPDGPRGPAPSKPSIFEKALTNLRLISLDLILLFVLVFIIRKDFNLKKSFLVGWISIAIFLGITWFESRNIIDLLELGTLLFIIGVSLPFIISFLLFRKSQLRGLKYLPGIIIGFINTIIAVRIYIWFLLLQFPPYSPYSPGPSAVNGAGVLFISVIVGSSAVLFQIFKILLTLKDKSLTKI